MVTNTKANIKMENSMGKGNILGPMVHATKVNSSKELGMVKEVGNLQNLMETFTQVRTKMIRKMDMEDTYGRTDACIKEVLQTT